MALRHSERIRMLNKVGKRPPLLSSARFATSDGEEHLLCLSSVLSAVTGRNGAGKTTLLRALHEFVDSQPPNMGTGFQLREISGFVGGTPWHREGSDNVPPPIHAYYVDPVREIVSLTEALGMDSHREDWLDGLDPSVFEQVTLNWASYVLGREYENLAVYEVTSFSEDDEPIPYFVASAHGCTYSCLEMGRGELAVIYLFWKLSRMKSGSLILIEEPEANLAAYSQPRIVDALAGASVAGGHQIVMSSHRPDCLISISDIKVTSVRSLPGFSLTSDVDLEDLGITTQAPVAPSQPLHIFVEDSVAGAMVCALLKNENSTPLSDVSIWQLGSDSHLKGIAENLVPYNSGQKGIVLLLDGDGRPGSRQANSSSNRGLAGERGSLPGARVSDNEGWLGVLPGWHSPELVLKTALKSRELSLDDLVPDAASKLRSALTRAEGLEIHDWFRECAKPFGSFEELWRSVWPVLMDDPELSSQVRSLSEFLIKNSS